MACTPGSLTMENYRNAERPTGNSQLATQKLGTLNSNPTFGRYP
jgi:hypothetical protein